MILINLLPHRERALQRQKERFLTRLGLSALLGVVVCCAVFFGYQRQIATQQERNSFLQAEVARLDNEIKDVATLEEQIASLSARQAAVEDLQDDRNLPVHLLNELVSQLPDGVYLTSLKQEEANVLLTGVAQSQERVSELLRNLYNQSVWLSKPQLVEIVAASGGGAKRSDAMRVANFTMRATLARPAVSASTTTGSGTTSVAPVAGKV